MLYKAELRTEKAVEIINQLENILEFSLINQNTFNWDTLKDNSTFNESKPQPPKLHDVPNIPTEFTSQNKPDLVFLEKLISSQKIKSCFNRLKPQPPKLHDVPNIPTLKPQIPMLQEVPLPPIGSALKYRPTLSLLDIFSPSRKMNKKENAEKAFKEDYEFWEKQKEEILKYNADTNEKYQKQLVLWQEDIQKQKEEILIYNANANEKYQKQLVLWQEDIQKQLELKREIILKKNNVLEEKYKKRLELWQVDEQAFLTKQRNYNDKIDKRKDKYLNQNRYSIINYCKTILSNSEYPDCVPKKFKLDYNPETGILILEYSLPSLDKMPRIKDVKYIQSQSKFVENYLPDSAINKLYDNVIYQIALRTVDELYNADIAMALEAIVFNGWVVSTDKATGKKIDACIISVMANRSEFLSLNLWSVDPKICFKHLKGIGSSKLFSLTPIAPVLTISREDKRFISSYAVADGLGESNNLATMDWEDFEHLIRELFEKEFAQFGGEVKVTQASRDGGVDAVAFDPNPIRGGKIVIQAKRYTNTVGVAAVRDLFGTVMNEGATKGILVTTADYGPDAYEFAKGKPLTLLSGSNLLHLLEKHGHKATINLKEAKQILADKEKNNE